MRCLSCNTIMNDFEATRKGVNTNDYMDLCDRCFGYIEDEVDVIEREDLDTEDGMSLDLDVDNDEY